MSKKINRRKFFVNTGISAAGIVIAGNYSGSSPAKKQGSSYNLMDEVLKYRKIDAHAHVHLGHGGPETQIEYADRLGIDKLIISRPIVKGKGTPEEVRESNNIIIESVRQFPGRCIGQFTLVPTFQKESLEEIDRCVDNGLVGLKAFSQVKINDPLFYPIVEKCIDLKMIVFLHAECQLGVGGYRMKYDVKKRPNVSIPEDFVDIARRYPEGIFQWAHIGGGGDWEYMCKALQNSPNVYVDTSGSNNEENLIDFALKHLGEDRMLFGSDSSYYQSVGKIIAANLTETQRKKIFFENYNNILRKAGNNVT